MKKPIPSGLGFHLFNPKVTTTRVKLYFLCFLFRLLSSNEIVKLTIAPTVAKTTVFAISSEERLGTILKNVPPAVPINVGLFAVISCS